MTYTDFRKLLMSGKRSDVRVRIVLDDPGAHPPPDPGSQEAAAADACSGTSNSAGASSARAVLHELHLHLIVLEEASEWAQGLDGGWAEVRACHHVLLVAAPCDHPASARPP